MGTEMADEKTIRSRDIIVLQMREPSAPDEDTAMGQPGLDRSSFAASSSFTETDAADRVYWLSRTPKERLAYMETLRRRKYGSLATAGIQRVIKIVKLSDT